MDRPRSRRVLTAQACRRGAIHSDTYNAARKAKRLLAELVQKQAEAVFRKQMGDEECSQLSDIERAQLLRVHPLDCH